MLTIDKDAQMQPLFIYELCHLEKSVFQMLITCLFLGQFSSFVFLQHFGMRISLFFQVKKNYSQVIGQHNISSKYNPNFSD
jgi:hypothetical protein